MVDDVRERREQPYRKDGDRPHKKFFGQSDREQSTIRVCIRLRYCLRLDSRDDPTGQANRADAWFGQCVLNEEGIDYACGSGTHWLHT